MHDDLIERIKQLSEHWASLPSSDELHEQMTQVYHKKSLSALLHCVQNADGSKKSEDQQFLELSEFLKTNWGHINGTCMSYTAQPESELTQLLCDIASVLGLQKKKSAIHLLMPGVATESIVDKYKNLNELDLKEVLRTHILGQDGSYLIPVTILLDVTQCHYDGTLNGRYNPYYDYAKHANDKARINDEECSRLIGHSPATQALHDTTERSIQIEKQQIDLLSQLNNLCRTLHFNDAHGGIGLQKRAGEGAYLAIVQFQEFFGQLSPESRDKIPQPLFDEIKLLINVSSDSTQNRNAAENIQTCIGTRREKISGAMKGHETLLESIRLDEDSQQVLKKQAEAARNKARNELEAHCDRKTYKGKDVLGVNPSFLQWLDIAFAVRSIADINILMRCSARDIHEIINSNPRLLISIAEQLNFIERLIDFIVTGHEYEKVRGVLRLLANYLDCSARDFSSLLLPLNLEQVELVCSALKARLKDIIKNGEDFGNVLQLLEPEQCAMVCSAIKDHFKDIIKNGVDFVRVQQALEPEQRAVVYNAFKDHTKDIIKNGWDFERVLRHLAPEQRAEVYNALKDRFKDIINNGEDFGYVLEYLAPEQRAEVYSALKDHFKDIIKNGEDFGYVLEYLAPEQRAEVYISLKDHFKDIIKKGSDFGGIQKYLEPELRAEVYNLFKDYLKDIIKDGRDFGRALQYLTQEQCVVVCISLKDCFKDIIKNGGDFINVQHALELKQFIATCAVLEDRLKDIIKNKEDFGAVLCNLAPLQCRVICIVISDHTKDFIKNSEDFGYVLRCLTVEKCTEVCTSLNDRLKDIIKNSEDFINVQHALELEQFVVICTVLKDRFKDIIKNSEDFGYVLRCLTAKKCVVVCYLLKDHFKNIIKNGEDFGRALTYLTPEQGITVFSELKDSIKASCLSSVAILDQEKGRKIHLFWFDNLLQNFSVSAEKQAIVNPLKETLTQASKNFFEQNYTPEGYQTFKKTCQDAINTARPQLRGWGDFFKKLALAIVTIGLAPAILAVHSKVTKGSFNFSFFPEIEEQAMDKLLNCVGDIPRVEC